MHASIYLCASKHLRGDLKVDLIYVTNSLLIGCDWEWSVTGDGTGLWFLLRLQAYTCMSKLSGGWGGGGGGGGFRFGGLDNLICVI